MGEEERAALFRQQEQARQKVAYDRWKTLAGSAMAYTSLVQATEALLPDEGWDPVEYLTEDERDVLGN